MNGVGWRICVAYRSSRSLINGDGSPVLRVFTKSPVEISFHRTLETFSARIIVPLAAFFIRGNNMATLETQLLEEKKKIHDIIPQRKLME